VPVVLLAFLGARVGYVLSHPSQFTSLGEVLRVDRGGLTSHGALAGGAAALWWAARRRRLDFWSLADAAVWAVPLGNIFVRWGNFMNGELYGDPTTLPWGVTFPGVPSPRHPLQIYEMLWAAVVLALTWPRIGRRRFAGELFWTVITLVSAGRIAWDLLRSDDRVVWVITLGHIPAAALLVAGVWVLGTTKSAGGN
jgi:phosphatidylglycerol:prolipoprotein diacylglycerol transferase